MSPFQTAIRSEFWKEAPEIVNGPVIHGDIKIGMVEEVH